MPPSTMWFPCAPDGYVAICCVVVADFEEPTPDSVYCISARLTVIEETSFVEQPLWSVRTRLSLGHGTFAVHSIKIEERGPESHAVFRPVSWLHKCVKHTAPNI
jgi:Vacuolar protein sorting-associated protein 62